MQHLLGARYRSGNECKRASLSSEEHSPAHGSCQHREERDFHKDVRAGGGNINPEVPKEVLALPLSSSVTLNKLHSFSQPWLPHLSMKGMTPSLRNNRDNCRAQTYVVHTHQTRGRDKVL